VQEQEEINALAEQVLEGSDLFLVEAELKGSTGNRTIWIYVESESGNISLSRCAEISRELQLLLDAGGWHDRKYTLNVSSPGLDRPLKDIRQYVNNVGRNASVVYIKDGEQIRTEGKLIGAESDKITLETGKNESLTIPIAEIEETRILASFK